MSDHEAYWDLYGVNDGDELNVLTHANPADDLEIWERVVYQDFVVSSECQGLVVARVGVEADDTLSQLRTYAYSGDRESSRLMATDPCIDFRIH